MKNKVAEFARQEHDNCAVLFLLSHGGSVNGRNSYIVASKEGRQKKVYIQDLIDILQKDDPEHSASLFDKPKLIFVQACDGGKKKVFNSLHEFI